MKTIKQSRGLWKGKEVETMTKEELIQALEQMNYIYKQLLESRKVERL